MSARENARRNRIKTVMKSILILLGVGMLYALFVTVTGWKIPCVFHEVTGWYCPGCGMTRMCLALMHLDFSLAFRCNPLIFSLLPVFLVVAVYLMLRYIRLGTCQAGKWLNILLVVLVILLIGFGVARNLPGMEMLQPPANLGF